MLGGRCSGGPSQGPCKGAARAPGASRASEANEQGSMNGPSGAELPCAGIPGRRNKGEEVGTPGPSSDLCFVEGEGSKPGREGPVSVMDFGEIPWDDFNYRPIVDIVANKKSVYRWF